MKQIVYVLVFGMVFFSCKNEKETQTTQEITSQESETQDVNYASFGMKINDADALPSERMMVHYKSLKEGDTINAKMKGTITSVCSKKGCWMRLDMGDNNEVMVRFKDYGFFMPLNAEGEVVVNGKAFVNETSVEDLRHYAEDDGKSPEEIAAITEPKFEYKFLADGVLLKQ